MQARSGCLTPSSGTRRSAISTTSWPPTSTSGSIPMATSSTASASLWPASAPCTSPYSRLMSKLVISTSLAVSLMNRGFILHPTLLKLSASRRMGQVWRGIRLEGWKPCPTRRKPLTPRRIQTRGLRTQNVWRRDSHRWENITRN